MLRSVLALVLAACLALSLPSSASAQSANLTYYLCAILQGSSYTAVDTATLVVSATTSTPKDYNGNNNTAYTALALSSGQRVYSDLTKSPAAVQTVAMTSLAAPGSIGGNDNLFWPGTVPQMLDGDGLTFNFASPITITGQAAQGTQMDLWWASGSNQLAEEVQGGKHETVPLQSTLSISTTQSACTVPASAPLVMCLLINGNGYTSAISGFINASSPAPVASSSANGLSASQQGWTVQSISNGQRTFTPSQGSATTTSVASIASPASIVQNDNTVYPDYLSTGAFDLQGLGLTFASGAPLADGSTPSTIAVKYANGQYYEQSAASTETTSTSYLALYAYTAGSSTPPCQAVATTYQYCWSVQGASLYSSVISGVMTINPLPSGTAANPYWTILSVTGSRTYQDFTTGATTVSQISNLLATGNIGGNDNKLFLKGYNGQSSQLLDGDGFSVAFTSVPPVFGQYSVNATMNMVGTAPHHTTPHHTTPHQHCQLAMRTLTLRTHLSVQLSAHV